jgi:broad specificity phosphatase PhoE
LASGTAVAPIAAALFAAGLAAYTDVLISQTLRPDATARAHAEETYVSQARERSLQLFALESPAAVARQRHEAFKTIATTWQRARSDQELRAQIAAALRSLIAAATYTASSGSQYAPLVACALGGSEAVISVLKGKY